MRRSCSASEAVGWRLDPANYPAPAALLAELDAVHERVVIFDGGMGATLEAFDLSLEDDYKLPGRAHEALILNRPEVIEGVHRSMVEAVTQIARAMGIATIAERVDSADVLHQLAELGESLGLAFPKAADTMGLAETQP